MRIVLCGLLVTAASLAWTLENPACGIGPERDKDKWVQRVQLLQHVCFDSDLDSFSKFRDTRDTPFVQQFQFDWTTDACTIVPNQASLAGSFAPACIKHDFCYRNLKPVGIFFESVRASVDENFFKDMSSTCPSWDDFLRIPLIPNCEAAAGLYYMGVRLLGEFAAKEDRTPRLYRDKPMQTPYLPDVGDSASTIWDNRECQGKTKRWREQQLQANPLRTDQKVHTPANV
ncbi:Phospholipase A2 [Metarhizium album ARSEF 1941]|uniref:Phospholipase A2 n=1 Tax=Metarhizium album (strain ARSEF 1941) TaxID=1081103 RepID=A0A0B2WR30_METAS|nr:Phospholipase A2 [Metarhizium album ARSEF 1941]KHN96079.1 Phospholipase A2 [Metarhizium album ARSEF 1941]